MRTTRKVSVCLLAVSVSCLGVLFMFSNSVWPKDAENANPRVKELQAKRIAVLQDILDVAQQLYQQGRVSSGEVHTAQRELLTARIASADTQKERIKACDEALPAATHLQEVIANKKMAGQATEVEELKARVFLLEIQIAREKAEAGE